MKPLYRFSLVVLAMIVVVAMASAQDMPTVPGKEPGSSFQGGAGMTWIDGVPHFLFTIQPDIGVGKIGFGLDVNIRVNAQTGKIREEDFRDTYSYFKMLRYVRYGMKGDDTYLRLGQLSYSRLGDGFIMNNYRNNASYDMRKLGAEFDLNLGFFGFEFVYSDFDRLSLIGGRAYVQPFKLTPLENVPLIKNIEVGATYVTDRVTDARLEYWTNASGIKTDSVIEGKAPSVYGFDVGLPWLSFPWIKSKIYGSFAKIIDRGNGAAAGINFDFSGMGLLRITAKYERRFLGDKFYASYFDALYERERYQAIAGGKRFVSKFQRLDTVGAVSGNYGELLVDVGGVATVVGSYYAPIGVVNQGEFHARLIPSQDMPMIHLSAGFDKKQIGRVFYLDENSIAYGEVGYKPYPFMLVTMYYEWTFKEDPTTRELIISKRVEPRVTFLFKF
jgi:hypothetical protein